MDAWQQFFIRAGIPREISTQYAKSFTTNRITKEMLGDLDKATLAELGVSAIGDQLLILKRIAAGGARDAVASRAERITAPQRARITAPTDVTQASHHRKGRPPPDRNEIYHVKMPVGSTARTQKILEKARTMRAAGLAVRGTTGVRQGGRPVSPIDKTSQAARGARKPRDFGEVSSSTDFLRGRIQKVGMSGRIVKNQDSRMTGIRIQVKNDTRNNRHQRVQYYSNPRDQEEEEEVEMEEEEEEFEEVYEVEDLEFDEDEEDEPSTVTRHHPRVTYSNPRKSNNPERNSSSSIFDRVSYR